MNFIKGLIWIVPSTVLILLAGKINIENAYLGYGISIIMTVIGISMLILFGKKLRDEELGST